MGIHKEAETQNPTGVIAVTCDNCTGLFSLDVAKTTRLSAAIVAFKAKGWRQLGSSWLCPECATKMEANE